MYVYVYIYMFIYVCIYTGYEGLRSINLVQLEFDRADTRPRPRFPLELRDSSFIGLRHQKPRGCHVVSASPAIAK